MKIIAETASNHMGNIAYLKALCEKVYNSGADFVTFQMFDIEEFLTCSYKNYSLFENIEIPLKDWEKFLLWAMKKNLPIIPCALDNSTMNLCSQMNISSIKIHSTDILNLPFLSECNSLFSEVFLEVGGSKLEEIQKAVDCFTSARVNLIYGFNDKPTKLENQNLLFLETLAWTFSKSVGFADHTTDTNTIPLLAMGQGAQFLEKHVTMDKGENSRLDNEVSVDPTDIRVIKENIEKYRCVFGKRIRFFSEAENNFRNLLYKKIVAKERISEGHILTGDDFALKRAAFGLTADHSVNLIGKRVLSEIIKDQPILRENLI